MVGSLALQTLHQMTASGCHGGGLMVMLLIAAQLAPQALLTIAVLAFVVARPDRPKKKSRVVPDECVLRSPRQQR